MTKDTPGGAVPTWTSAPPGPQRRSETRRRRTKKRSRRRRGSSLKEISEAKAGEVARVCVVLYLILYSVKFVSTL